MSSGKMEKLSGRNRYARVGADARREVDLHPGSERGA
jgi:hypothetical protein